MSAAEEELAALASSLVDEIATARTLELARSVLRASLLEGNVPSVEPHAPGVGMPKLRHGSGAVHPHLGWHLIRHPGDTISGHAYAHLRASPVPPA